MKTVTDVNTVNQLLTYSKQAEAGIHQKADCLYEWLLPSDSAAECQGSMAGNIGRNW